MELMIKFSKDFNDNLYDGIDLEKDAQKLKAYVGYFAEFRNTIQKEQNAVDRENGIMSDHLNDLESLKNILVSLEKQLLITKKLKGDPRSEGAYKHELSTLLTEYKMYQTKKVKIETNYDCKKLEFKGVMNGLPMVGETAPLHEYRGHNFKKYERLVDDYGHRRYIRRAQRMHRVGNMII
jgi:hypothetical protein